MSRYERQMKGWLVSIALLSSSLAWAAEQPAFRNLELPFEERANEPIRCQSST